MSYIPIVSTVDDNYAQHYGVMLTSLLRNKSNNTDIHAHILDAGLSDENIIKIKSIASYFKTQITIYKNNIVNSCHHFKTNGHILTPSYYRIYIGSILPHNIKRVLYLDCDIVVLKDLSDLFNTNLSEYQIGCVPDPIVRNDKHVDLSLSTDTIYFNAGVILIDLEKWRDNGTESVLSDYIPRHEDVLTFLDQDALNAVFDGKYYSLERTYNTFSYLIVSPKLSKPTPHIIHYVGSLKPWHFNHRKGTVGKYYEYLSMTPWRDYVVRHRSWANFTQRIKKLGKIHKLLSFNN